jgi:hypothetical protein
MKTRSLFAQFAIISVFFALTAYVATAETRIDKETESNIDLTVDGTITKQDARRFEQLAPRFAFKGLHITLNSQGGDAFAAMTIGRIARKFDAQITVYNQCYSSCALIFIGGVSRLNFGELGLHRPYMASEPESREKLEKSVPEMLSAIHDYVKEMRITDRFYELMVNTEPSELVRLTEQETEQIVPVEDPVWDEHTVSVSARQIGLTTAEMRERDQRAKACEQDFDMVKEWKCKEAIRWGLSKETYEERDAKAKSQCRYDNENRFSPTDELAFKGTPRNERINLPFVIAWEKCVRKVMTAADK